MLVVTNLRVWTLVRDSLTITWEFRRTVEDLSGYTITILRSEAEEGEYEEVSPAFATDLINEFEDSGVSLFSRHRRYYYRLRVTNGEGTYKDFGSTDPDLVLKGSNPGGITNQAFPDLEASESIRAFDLLAKNYVGRRVLVLTERTTGQRCPACWDELKRRKSKSGCSSCYDTSITNGFYYPRECWAVKPPEQLLVQLGLLESQRGDLTMLFSSRPRLKPRDLVVGIDGARWRVKRVVESGKGWAVTRQTAVLTEVTRDQIEYDISIDPDDWDVDSFTASPHKQFINATDIDSYRRAARELGVTDQ